MKKTYTINISGIVFYIDEDAYEKLQQYLDEINSRFADAEESREIIADVEARIAELFRENLAGMRQVITITDVEAIIRIMGNPEDFGDDETSGKGKRQERQKGSRRKFGKRVYRDPDDRILGGVGGGLGAYFGVDPLIMRILLICTFFFSGPLLYLILWIIIPEAGTTAQKLEMRGEPVTIGNIERSIRDEFNTVKNNLKNKRKKETCRETEGILQRIVMVFLAIINILVRVILIIIGVALVFTGVVLIIGFLIALFTDQGVMSFDGVNIHSIALSELLGLFVSPDNQALLWTGLILVVGLPVLAIIYGGIRIIFRIKAGNRIPGAIGFLAWICGLVILSVVVVAEGKKFITTAGSTSITPLKDTISDIFYLEMGTAGNYYYDEYFTVALGDIEFVAGDEDIKLYGRPKIDIVKSETGAFKVIVKRKARGKNKKDAVCNAEKIRYNWIERDSLLIFDPFYTLPSGEEFRVQEIELVLSVPVGKTICPGEGMENVIYDVYNVENYFDREMIGKKWVMKAEGLSLVD
ncbi:MAG: PspC domain-containing protein [Bacteroidetes bacterium]|nr:PspC domain-containing protein [Bacteroidota bacterium]